MPGLVAQRTQEKGVACWSWQKEKTQYFLRMFIHFNKAGTYRFSPDVYHGSHKCYGIRGIVQSHSDPDYLSLLKFLPAIFYETYAGLGYVEHLDKGSLGWITSRKTQSRRIQLLPVELPPVDKHGEFISAAASYLYNVSRVYR